MPEDRGIDKILDEFDELDDSEIRKRLSGAAIRVFFKIMETWNLDIPDARAVLGLESDLAAQDLKNRAPDYTESLSREILTRISFVLGIHNGLCLLFHDDAERIDWLDAANDEQECSGITPRERILEGTLESLSSVRACLDRKIEEKIARVKSGDVEGRLEAFYETGTEGVHWSIQEHVRKGYDSLHPVRTGDHLTVFGDGGDVLWSDTVKLEYQSRFRPFPRNPEYGQQEVCGFWVHGLQEGMDPEEWADMFFAERQARLRKDPDSLREYGGPRPVNDSKPD